MTKDAAEDDDAWVRGETLVAATPSGAHDGPAPVVPSVFANRYEVHGLLGSGGMGTVYLAKDRELDDLVALKVLRLGRSSSDGLVDMFRREVRTARKITHPNVARVFDIGDWEGTKYFTMEYVDGASLGRLVDKRGPLDVSRALEIARHVCAGLDAAHKCDVIHRDLKPDNVLIGQGGRVAITDFGIARSLGLATPRSDGFAAVGTPAYMAPEQLDAEADLDLRADLYALGVLLFEIFTGALPFAGSSAVAMAMARLSTAPADPRTLRPELPHTISRVVLRCLERDRERRFASAVEVAAALEAVTQPLPASKRPEADRSSVAIPPATKSVAVAPFVHGADDALLAEGLWDDLIDGLSMVNGLRVRTRDATLDETARSGRGSLALGKALGVDVVVEGALRRSGNRLRFMVRLIGTADAFQLWGERFEVFSNDLFALSDRVATGIAAALTVQPVADSRAGVDDPEAMRLYLLAKQDHRTRFLGDPQAALDLLERALARVPDNATILATYAVVKLRAWFFGLGGSERVGEAALAAAARALELAPHLADARHALAQVYLHMGDAARATIELQTVLRRSDYCPAHETMGAVLSEIGLVHDARRHLNQARSIEPTSAIATHEVARLHAFEGDWDAADGCLERLMAFSARDIVAARRLKARFAFWRRDMDGARALLAAEQSAWSVGPMPGSILQSLVDVPDAAAMRAAFSVIRSLQGSPRRRCVLYQLSCEASGMFEDEAWLVESLDLAIESSLIDLMWMDRCPLLAFARDLPSFRRRRDLVAERARQIETMYRSG